MSAVPDIIQIKEELTLNGWVLLNLPAVVEGGAKSIFDFASIFGIPSTRDGNEAIWPISPKRNKGTFSETSNLASLHTDAQYHSTPEHMIMLLCDRPASDGGVSSLLNVSSILSTLTSVSKYADLYAALKKPIWRWQMPTVFSKEKIVSDPKTIITDKDTIHWRYDNLTELSSKSKSYAREFYTLIENNEFKKNIFLNHGDILIFNNHTILHGRTKFTDPHRLLYRVRLWNHDMAYTSGV